MHVCSSFPIRASLGLEYLEPCLDRWRRFDATAPDTQLFLLFISLAVIFSSCDGCEAIGKGVMKVFHHNFLNEMRSLFAFDANAKKTDA